MSNLLGFLKYLNPSLLECGLSDLLVIFSTTELIDFSFP